MRLANQNGSTTVGDKGSVTDAFRDFLKIGEKGNLLARLIESDEAFVSSLRIDNALAVSSAKALLMPIQSRSVLELCGNDRLFQNALRIYASVHFLLGGNVFARPLSERIGSSESSINRWLNGHTSPNSDIKQLALENATYLVEGVLSRRLSDEGLGEVTALQ